MNQNIFDIAIIGAGVSGTAIARRLSAYQVRIALLEQCADVSFGVSKANSGIIHAGFHHDTKSLKSRLELRGNLMFEQLHNELNFPFRRIGIMVIAFSHEEMEVVTQLYRQGIKNGVSQLEICSADRVATLEPKLSGDIEGGLLAPTGGIVEPYRYVFALTESAVKNGVTLKTDFAVCRTSRENNLYNIEARSGNNIQAKYVINAAGLYADEVSRIFHAEEYTITPRKGEEFLLDRNSTAIPEHVIFPVPSRNSKGVLIIPTVEGTMMIGPTAEETDDKQDSETTERNLKKVFTMATQMIPSISKRDIITAFSGSRPILPDGDFYIDISEKAEHFIQVAGIQSPGLTASPAIAEYVKDLLKKDGLTLTEKREYDPFIVRPHTIRDLSRESADALIKKDPAFGNIICRCESISEAEIVEAIHKGHTTLDGIKFYTRSGMGRCQGGFCTYKILQIISRETGIPIEQITKRGGQSRLVLDKITAGSLDRELIS